MDSFPHQRNQMPYAQQYCPSFETIPPLMKMDASRSPVTYEGWPYGGNYCYSVPIGCHSCCNHNHSSFHGYYGFRPPYPYYPPPSQFHCHGGYPSFPETYPLHYVPPPHYSMDQPTYEYDKNVPRDHHCCGCPNHSCNRKEDRRVKIEEQEPDIEPKSKNSSVPFEFQNQPYPVVWIPPGYMKNSEQRNPNEQELKEKDEYPRDASAHEYLKPPGQEPIVWNGCFPFDINNGGSPKHGGDRKSTQNRSSEDRNQFPFPIIWMPYKPEEEGGKKDHKEANTTGQESAEKSTSNSNATSAHFPGSDDTSVIRSRASEEKIDSEVGSKILERKNGIPKIIPVKQLEEHDEKRIKEEVEGKAKVIAVKDREDHREKNPSEYGSKRVSSPQQKMSKLPPLCLRVDPLPKKKNSNGSSRSPSPPGSKEKSWELFDERSCSTSPKEKVKAQQDMQSSSYNLNKTKELELNERQKKVAEVVNVVTKQDSGENCKIQSQSQAPNNTREVKEHTEARDSEKKISGEAFNLKDATINVQPGDDQLLSQDDKGESEAKDENPEVANKAKRKKFSKDEAAMVIQSAYRGYEVRKWEPLKKLKQIAEVRERVVEVRSQIKALESSPGVNKQRVVIGETIMNLLLKLDTIQGRHPTVRDFRKSVAKELVSLQEKLDSLTTKECEVSIAAELVEDLSLKTRENDSTQGEQKKAEADHGNNIRESNHDQNSGSVEQHQCLVSHPGESTSGSQVMETAELRSVEKVCEEAEEAEPDSRLKDGLDNEALDDGEIMTLKTQIEDSKLELPVESLPLIAEENLDSVVEVTVSSCLCDESSELSGVPDQELAIWVSKRNEQTETGKTEVLQGGEVESVSAIDIISTDGSIVEMNSVQPSLNALEEEPVVAEFEYVGVKPQKLLSQIDDHVEIESEFTLQAQGGEESNINDLLDTYEPLEHEPELSLVHNKIQDEATSKPEQPHPKLSLADNESLGGEAFKLEILRPELSPLEYQIVGEEASKPEVPQLELSPADNEIHGREDKPDKTMTNDEDNCWMDKEMTVEEIEDCEMESGKVIIEENQERVKNGHEPEAPEPVVGSDVVIEAASKEKVLIATQWAPADVEREGELLPMSPSASNISIGSEIGSENDRKLIEENEKLREMMEKLIEAGRQQLIAISHLTSRVKNLEKKLAKKKKLRTRSVKAAKSSSCVQPSNDSLKGRAHEIAM